MATKTRQNAAINYKSCQEKAERVARDWMGGIGGGAGQPTVGNNKNCLKIQHNLE